MDIKSMQDRFRKKIVGNITLVSIIIIGCLCISTYCHSMYSYYKSPSSHSEQYFNLKNYVQNWKHNAYQQNLYIYSVTDYLNVFENPQNKLNSYSGDSGWINYLVYNTKTKKYLTNSGELQDYISNNNERVSIDSYIQNNIASKYYTSANAVNSLVDRYESINHAQYIKNNSEYVLQFWIPQKLFEKGEELGKIKTEDINNKVLSTVYLLARLLFTGIIIIILISLYKSPKEEVIKGIKDSIIYKILLYLYNWILGIKEDLFNRKSIVFKFFIYVFALIVLGIFIAAFMYREIIIPMYLILIVYSIFKLINFLTTLQKIINYSSDFSIDSLKKAIF
ncbi:MAG: hypothetical protein RR645_04340 [Clostridium sp.]